ncbi:MAG: M48 family metallopeptidase [Ectothiorhodospiraceae bacterium]|nr:M48 family metallopeptidase [Ectothiorhodospiraceae bacterium]
MKRLLIALLTVLFMLPAPLWAERGEDEVRLPQLGDSASRSLSITQERRLGEELIREIRQRLPLHEDPEIQYYIADLGQRLLARAEGPEFDYNFFVVDSSTINAFAMPGGNIGINTGLILRTQSESELAGVMAHEIAHVTQRHIARRLEAQRGSGFRTLGILMAAILMGIHDPEMGSAAAMTGIAGSVQEQLNYSRNHEREADNIGIRILADAGLDPEGMPRFFERLHQATQFQTRPPEFLSTHPVTENRIAESRARAQGYRPREVQESPMYDMVRARLLVAQASSPGDAVTHFRSLLENAPDHAGARYGLALALTAQGQTADAKEILEGLMKDQGEHVFYFSALARAQWKQGERDQALATYQLGLDLFPDNRPLAHGYAETLIQAGEPEQARNVLQRQLRQSGQDPALYRLLAQAASDAGRPQESRMAMAEYYQLHGQFRLAIEQLNQVIDGGDADLYDKSRAVSRRQELVRAFESRNR